MKMTRFAGYVANLLVVVVLFGVLPAIAAPGADPGGGIKTVEEIIAQVDRLYRSKTSHVEMEMSISTPDWKRTMRMEAWSEGMSKTFIVIMEPKKDQGISTLRMDNDMWNYFPKIDKVMKVPPSMMMSSWMGSDLTNDDLVKESTLLDDYRAELTEQNPPDPEFYFVQLIPKAKTPTVWGKIRIQVRKSDLLPVQQDYYDEKGTLMRVMYFKEITSFGGRQLPSVMEVIPQSKKGNKTTIRYLKAEFDRELDADTFSLRNLQKKR